MKKGVRAGILFGCTNINVITQGLALHAQNNFLLIIREKFPKIVKSMRVP